MFHNIGLKLKVFFFIAIVFALLSYLNFVVFDQVVEKINIQNGALNSFKYMEEKIKNHQFKLIADAHNIADNVKVVVKGRKRKRKVIFDFRDVEKNLWYALIDSNGAFVAGNFDVLNSFKGVTVYERAVGDGAASDGYLAINGVDYLTAAVPFRLKVSRDRKKNMILITAKKLVDSFQNMEIGFPFQVYSDKKMVYMNKPKEWKALLSGKIGPKVKSKIQDLLQRGENVKIDRWNMAAKYVLPLDKKNNHIIEVIGALSFVPGYKTYNRAILYIILYALGAIIISFIFTLIVTHSVDKNFRDLAGDVSKLKVGEKLVMHKYIYGAGMVVSAINHMVSKYQKHGETNPGINLDNFIKDQSEDELANFDEQVEIPAKQQQPEQQFSSQQKPQTQTVPPVQKSPQTSPDLKHNNIDEDDEKTQIASMDSIQAAGNAADPFDELWQTYRKVKIEHGDSVSDSERSSFVGKLKTNRATIMTKYNCKDVIFSIEVKDGKPVIKAKPLR